MLTGCGAGDDATDAGPDGSPGGDNASPATDAFPVSIEHALGETTIDSEPERVVTWSSSNQDVALALDVVPVAMSEFEYGGDDEGVLPWVRDALGDREVPTLLPNVSGEEIPYEAIAEAEPDVIVAVYSGITADEYETLSQIAPTVAYPDAPWSTPWQTQTRMIGRALGKSDEAEQLVTDTEAYLADKAAEYPQLQGTTFVYSTEDAGQLGISPPTTSGSRCSPTSA